jgi:hypothetical protein
MKCLLLSASICVFCSEKAVALPCSIHPEKGLSRTALAALAKVSQPEAEAAALKSVKLPSTKVSSGELEAEGGCLIYSFDIQVPGKKSLIEVAVDAGTGKVRSKKHEGPKKQAAEATADAKEN